MIIRYLRLGIFYLYIKGYLNSDKRQAINKGVT